MQSRIVQRRSSRRNRERKNLDFNERHLNGKLRNSEQENVTNKVEDIKTGVTMVVVRISSI